jgi:hypothetical protein
MLRFLLFVASVMATSASVAGDAAPCSVAVPLQIMTPGHGPEIMRSIAELSRVSDNPHFNAFVTTVTKYVAARLDKDKLCINNDESDYRRSDYGRSLLRFVRWPLPILRDFLVPAPSYSSQRPGSCEISSPWIDLAFERKPVPAIRAVVRWNERQLLADQAVLAGARNVPLGIAMPLMNHEFATFAGRYGRSEILHEPTAKPIEERTPPDLLWLFRRSGYAEFAGPFQPNMHKATEKGAAGYTKLVLALIARCFASDETKATNLFYYNILDAADLIPLEQYKIDRLRD